MKFIERNWKLKETLTARSRDNLPNPKHDDDAYVPRNMPAIGDLFDMFDFDRDGDRDRKGRNDDRDDNDHRG